MLWYCFWMLCDSLELINNWLTFAYVNMHLPVQEITEGLTGLRIPVGNVCGARSRCWLNSYPGGVLRFIFSMKQVQQLYPECIWCLILYQVRFHLSKSSLFLWKGEECLMHPLPSIKVAPFTHNLHSECAHHLCCLLLLLLWPVIQMRSVTRSLVAKQNVLLPDLSRGKSTYFLVSKAACSYSLHILIAKWVIYM